MQFYCYSAFGLTIRSEIILPELLPYEGDLESAIYDVNIVFGRVGTLKTAGATVLKDKSIDKVENELTITIPEVAIFGLKNGKRITIDECHGVSENSIRLFLLGSCMGLILQQRGIFSLHASGVVNDSGKAIIFMGRSGAGKSTICRHLVNEGYKYIGDDVLPVLKNSNGAYSVVPSYPHTKLWKESIGLLAVSSSEIHRRIRPDLDKYGVINKDNFHNGTLEIEQIYILSWTEEKEFFEARLLSKAEAVVVYRNQTYRNKTPMFKNENCALFEQCLELGQNFPLVRITRDQNNYHLNEIQQTIRLNLTK